VEDGKEGGKEGGREGGREGGWYEVALEGKGGMLNTPLLETGGGGGGGKKEEKLVWVPKALVREVEVGREVGR
jgi:hypothetical protein